MHKNISPNINYSNIPIFNGISSDAANKLLKNAKTTKYKKGQLICSYGEPSQYFLIVVAGLVKLFKSNENGDEIVFKVARESEALLEISFSPVYMGNAQAVNNAEILAIPTADFQATLQDDKTFAINMFTQMGNCTQNLVAHIEQLTLKTATQRIGWFLLKLLIEKSGADKKNIKLPYDKLLISEYLGMRPETFSRTIQQMNEYGINIDSKNVTLTDTKALCNFCTAETAVKCTDFDKQNCM